MNAGGISGLPRLFANSGAAGALIAAIAMVAPSPASAACAAPPQSIGPHAHARTAAVIIDAVALDGPQSPARFAVRRYEKGSGPDQVLVQTGVQGNSIASEGITPQAGERYRIFGTRGTGSAIIRTSVCAGTRQIEHAPGRLRLRTGGQRISAVQSTYSGRSVKRTPHSLRVRPRQQIAVTLQRPITDVISVTTRSGRLLTTANPRARSSRRFAFRLPSGFRRTQTLVLDTGVAFYAIRVKPTR